MSQTRKSTAHKSVDVVEAGYSLVGTDTEWLARVVDAATLTLRPAYVERALDPRFGALAEQLNREVPNAVLDVMARHAIICGGFGEVLGHDHPGTLHLRRLGREIGITDSFSVFAQDGEGHAVDLSGPAGGTMDTAPRVRGIWRRVGLHIAAGMRLRRRLVESAVQADAVLAPDGKVLHAEGQPRKSSSARDALMTSVRRMERARTSKERRDPERALELWQGLVAGEWSLVEKWESDGRRYIAAYRNRPDVRDPRALTAHESAVLHYASRGASNKEIGFALGLPAGSVATAVSQLLRKLGCQSRVDLVALAWAKGALGRAAERFDVPLGDGIDEVAVLALPAAQNAVLFARLTVAEREVAGVIVTGASTASIARSRGTSEHTVANQLRRIYQKLGVRTRAELVHAFRTSHTTPA